MTSSTSRAATIQNRAGLSGYIAEAGACMILADLGIAARPRPDHAAYISSWLKVLRNDTSAIFTAASKAQAAADWMHAHQPGQAVATAA